LINIVENPLSYSKENRQEFTNKQVLVDILNPLPQDNGSSNQNNQQNDNQTPQDNGSSTQNNQQNDNQTPQDNGSSIENLVLNDLQKQFEQQAKNLVGDQYLQSSRSQEQIANIEKNNLNSFLPDFNQASKELVIVEKKNNQIANSLVQKNKTFNAENFSQPVDQTQQNNVDLAVEKTGAENFLANKVKQIAKNTKDIVNAVANLNQEPVNQNLDNSQQKSVMALSPSGIGKAIAQTVTPVISTGSKISKVIIEKTLGIKSVNIPSVNNIQEKTKNLNEENLKQILLKSQSSSTNKSIGVANNGLEKTY
jgi:hypothetical protein